MTRFLEPANVEEACLALAADEWGAKAVAGGTALVLMMRQGLIEPTSLVSLRGIDGLEGVRRDEKRLWIGPLTTLHKIGTSAEVKAATPSLAFACRQVGNVRIRNVATIGGNLGEADYASDPPTVLASLDAECSVEGPTGSRSVRVRDLITGFLTTSLAPGEIITGVSIPLSPGIDRRLTYQKYVSRSSEDRPCVGVAAAANFQGAELTRLSVVVGAVAPVPQRLDDVTLQAVGGRLAQADRDSIARAYAEAIDPLEDARGSAWYRRRMIEVFVRRALESLSSP